MVPSAGETFTEQAYDGHAQEAAPAMHTRSQSTAQTQPHAELSMPLAQQQAHTAIELTPAIESHTVGAGEVVMSRDKPLLPSQVPTTPVGSDQWAHTDQTDRDVPSTGSRTGAVGIVSGPDPVPTVRHVVGSDAPGTEQRGGWALSDPSHQVRNAHRSERGANLATVDPLRRTGQAQGTVPTTNLLGSGCQRHQICISHCGANNPGHNRTYRGSCYAACTACCTITT